MKGAHALPLLLACAVAAGTALYYVRQSNSSPPPAAPAGLVDPSGFPAEASGLPSAPLPPAQSVSPDRLMARIARSIESRFGADGLAHRSRAYDLLGLLPPRQDLASLLLAMQGAGTRAWFDDLTGDLVTLEDFDLARPDDRATLVRLRTRQLLHGQFPPPPGHPGDDAWLAREAVHGGIASAVEARFLAATGGRSALPTSEETEREATLLSLPLFLHNLAQLGAMQGRDFVETHRDESPGPWNALLSGPPSHTLALFAPASPGPAPVLPDTGPALFEESLGAYATYLLLERLADYLQAEALVPSWRGDRYRLSSDASGDHLVWIVNWATPEASAQAAQLIENTLSPEPDNPAFGTEQRHTAIIARGKTTHFFNCADVATLRKLLQIPNPQSPIPIPP